MRNYRQFGYLVIVTMAAALVLVLTGYKAHRNSERLARFQERDIRQKAAYELRREVRDRIGMAIEVQLTIDAFEEAFGPVTELTDATHPKYAKNTHFYFHEKSRSIFYLRFKDGKLLGFSGHDSSKLDTGFILESPAFIRTEAVRSSVLLVALILWCITLLSAICSRRFRRNATLILVVLSMTCGLCWFLAPNYSPTMQGISSNDNLATFVFMLICSLAFGLSTFSQPFPNVDDRGRCRDPDQPASIDSLSHAT